MAARDRRSTQIIGPVAPARQRIEAGTSRQALRAPQGENGTANLFASGAICLVVFEIGGSAGAIILAHGVNPLRVLIGCMIVRKRARIEEIHALRLCPGGGAIVEEEPWIVRDQPFGKRLRQSQKHPMPGARGKPRIHAVPHVPGGDDVEHRKLFQPAAMVEREPITNASAAIMPGQAEADKTERPHCFNHGLGHGALGVGRMVGLRPRRRRPAVAREVGDHERKALRERWRHAVPHHVALRMAMKK